MLFAQLLLGVAQMGLSLAGDRGARGADLALDRGDRLAGDLADRAGHTRDVRSGRRRSAELLDACRHALLVVAGLGQMLAQPLLVRVLLRERYVGG
jgi:hypothetical protein